jgi:hypothetical protein
MFSLQNVFELKPSNMNKHEKNIFRGLVNCSKLVSLAKELSRKPSLIWGKKYLLIFCIFCFQIGNAQQPEEFWAPNGAVNASPNQNSSIGISPQPDWRFTLNLRGTSSEPSATQGLDIWTNTIWSAGIGNPGDPVYNITPAPDVFRVKLFNFENGAFGNPGTVYKIDGAGNVSGGSYNAHLSAHLRVGHAANNYLLYNLNRMEWIRPKDVQVSFLRFAADARLGLNIEAPEGTFHIKNQGDKNADFAFKITTGIGDALRFTNRGYLHLETQDVANEEYAFKITTGIGEALRFSNNGYLYLGANLNGAYFDEYRLYVQTGIRTEKIRVDIAETNGWADFVFENDYELMPLAELKSFIETHKHLPNVPSEPQVRAEGIDLAEMNAILLRQIEELTLRVIDLQEQVSQIEKRTSYENQTDR